jgi:two-component system, OmpR family, sensor kinase
MFRSLRWRIQIWHAIILATVIVVFASAMYMQQRQSRFQTIDNELTAAVEVLVGKLQAAPPAALQSFLFEERYEPRTNRDDPGGERFENRRNERTDDRRDGQLRELDKLNADLHLPNTFAGRRFRSANEEPYFVIWRDDGVAAKTSAFASVPVPPSINDYQDDRRQQLRDRDYFREAFALGPPGMVVLVGRDIGADMNDLSNLMWLLVGTGGVVFALGLAGGWLLSRNSVKPIEEITRVASDISERNLSDRIGATDMDSEFAALAGTLNATFARLESAFAQQAQFTADASHELRTPLSIIQMHHELALSKERTSDEYREVIATCQRATSRMNSLVESLLTLARVDADGLTLAVDRIDLAPVIGESIDHTQPLAAAKQIIVTPRLDSTFVSADRNRLAQVVTNLLTNAIAYSPQQSGILVSLEQDADDAIVTVADTGFGIPSEDLSNIFQRFYRVDKERSRDSGGSGLGLSICQTIVEAHGGSISVESQPGIGSTFRFRLPRS